MSNTVKELLETAKQSGDISRQSIQALVKVEDAGAQIQAALGIKVDDVMASEVVLVTLLIDDSGSIRFVSGNSQAVRDGHNLILEALKGSKQDDSVLIHTRYLNGALLYPYCPIKEAIVMDSQNYDPQGGTPLYDQSMVILGTVLTKTQEFMDNNVPVRSITLIVTDGNDEGSLKATAKDVASVVADLLRSERHIVAAMGVEDGHTDFTQIFKEMGIPDNWILTPGKTPSEIRKAFQVFSKSAVRASQSAKFSQTAMGGFGQ